MRPLSSRIAGALIALLLLLSASLSLPAKEEVGAALDKLLARMPVKTAAEKEEIAGEMVKLGEAGVRELCGRIKAQNEPLDGKVCSALFGLEHIACRAGNEKMRKMVADVYGEILKGDASIAAKSYLICELRTLGQAESVAPVAPLLTVPELCEPAAQTLVSLGTKDAAAALRQALPKLKGKDRVTVVCALGRLCDGEAAPLLIKEVESADATLRYVAVFALANTGDPAARAALVKAASTDEARERRHALHNLLRFARRLTANGHQKEAAAVCRELLANAGPEDRSVTSGAFCQLTSSLDKKEAIAEIVKGLRHDNATIRFAALRVASDMPGEDVTAELAKALPGLEPAQKAPLLEHLGQRGDAAGLPAAMAALEDEDKEVRIAAIGAVGMLGKSDVAPKVITFLEKGGDEAKAAHAALSIMADKKLNGVLVAALPEASATTRRELLEVLAIRDAKASMDVFLARAEDEDKGVRHTSLKVLASLGDEKVIAGLMKLLAKTESKDEREVIKRSLLEACPRLSEKSHKKTAGQLIGEYKGAAVPVKCVLVHAVRCMAKGYPEGLAHVQTARKDSDTAVQGEALRALAEWPTAEPMDDLLKVAGETKDMKEHAVALRGYVRMAGQFASSKKKEERAKALEAYQSAMAAARRTEEKKQVLGGVSALRQSEALEIAMSCLGDEALSNEAAAAAIKIGSAIRKEHGAAVKAAMQKIAEKVDNKNLRKQAEKLAR